MSFTILVIHHDLAKTSRCITQLSYNVIHFILNRYVSNFKCSSKDQVTRNAGDSLKHFHSMKNHKMIMYKKDSLQKR
jgi:hypothetical protein